MDPPSVKTNIAPPLKHDGLLEDCYFPFCIFRGHVEYIFGGEGYRQRALLNHPCPLSKHLGGRRIRGAFDVGAHWHPQWAPRPPRRQTWRPSADRWGMSGVNHPKSFWWTVREAYTQKIVFVSAKSRVIDKIEKIDVILMYVNIFFNYSRIYQYDMIHRYMLLHLHLYNLPKWAVTHGAGFLPWTQVRVNSCNFSKHVLK